MRKWFHILPFLFVSLVSCRKDEGTPVSGVATINNLLVLDNTQQTYIGYGFLFPKAKLVSSTDTPPPDITIDNDGTLANLILQANNLNNSFYMTGEYDDAASAEQAFKDMISPSVAQWEVWAFSVKENQIWIYRSGSEHYAKIRIISTVSEVRNSRDYAECTFEWVYQPDGTLTFPGK